MVLLGDRREAVLDDGAPRGSAAEDARVNDFVVRRLKKKLGTRAMASAETDFVGAHAEAVGDVERGFKNIVEHVLTTSRIFNAISCAGAMHAAWREAKSYAEHRRA